MKKTLYIFISTFFLTASALGQTMNAFIMAAENAFISKDYNSALTYYSNALEFDEKRLDLIYKTAESARLFHAYRIAEEKYTSTINNDGLGTQPDQRSGHIQGGITTSDDG